MLPVKLKNFGATAEEGLSGLLEYILAKNRIRLVSRQGVNSNEVR
jgi:hypothetical protein